MENFTLHERLAADTLPVIDLTLCTVRLMNDSQYSWLILIPRRMDIVEYTQLSKEDLAQLWAEVEHVTRVLQNYTQADKMNLGALGNMVPQLHVHIIARFRNDAAWPGPVWGAHPAVPYEKEALDTCISALQKALKA